MSDVLGAKTADLAEVQKENKRLRAELERYVAAERKAAERRKKVIKEGGKILLPLLDRKRVVRSFLELLETAQGYAGPREAWPEKDEVLEKGKLFALSLMRFAIRRRMLMFLFSLLAFTVPGLQLYVALKQNEIIENQNKYFNIQVYDTVAKSITSGDLTSKQITTALLAREDFEMLNGIIQQVFSTESGGAFTAQDAVSTRPLVLKDAAARGHLIAALTAALDRQQKTPAAELWPKLMPTLQWVLEDGSYRVPTLLRMGEEDAAQDPAVTQEVYRYLFNLGLLMRRSWSVAHTAGREAEFFASVPNFLVQVSQSRAAGYGPFAEVFRSSAQEMVMDLALMPRFGEPPPAAPQASQVRALLSQGFEKLKAGVTTAPVAWDGLKRVFGI